MMDFQRCLNRWILLGMALEFGHESWIGRMMGLNCWNIVIQYYVGLENGGYIGLWYDFLSSTTELYIPAIFTLEHNDFPIYVYILMIYKRTYAINEHLSFNKRSAIRGPLGPHWFYFCRSATGSIITESHNSHPWTFLSKENFTSLISDHFMEG